MSFDTGTQTELLYAMPSSAAAVTAAANTVMSYPNTTTFPAYQLRANFFPYTYGVGKSLLIKGGGWFTTSSTAMTQTISIALDTTAGTMSTIKLATGAFTPQASITSGGFEFEVMLTCTGMGAPGTTSGTVNGVGHLFWGAANNAATATNAAETNVTMMMGAMQTPLAISTSNAYFIEAFSSWSLTTGAPTITLTNFLIFGLN